LLFPGFCPGCQDYYSHDIDAAADILIIEGIITDKPGPDSIKLTRAVEYDITSGFPAETGASVLIIDDKDNVEILGERSPGVYYTSDRFDGIVGNTYTLRVETAGGHTYVSKPVTIRHVPEIEIMYAEFGVNEILKKNLNGDYILEKDPGMHIYFDLPPADDDNLYLKFEWFAAIQYMVYISFPLESIDDYRTYITSSKISSNNPVVNVLNPSAVETSTLSRNHLGFFGMSHMEPTAGPPPTGGIIKGVYTYGIILYTWLQSIDEEAYTYWKNIEKQIYNEGKLFDPINTQVYGNLSCKTDPERLVLGYFSASSVSNYAFYSYLRSDSTIYSRKVEIDPDTLEIRYDSILPPVWIWPEH
jgi:hypothetical protein